MKMYKAVPLVNPGDVVELADITQLPQFEDAVAIDIDPDMTDDQHDAWAGRIAIRDIIRPPKFNGRIVDIQLVSMADPYERLYDARERGWLFHPKSMPGNLSANQEFTTTFQGFRFLADAVSTGRGVIGQIQAELWYGSVPLNYTVTGKTYKNRTQHAGATVRRIITRPKIEKEKFIALDEQSRKIGLEVLQQAIRKPHKIPMKG